MTSKKEELKIKKREMLEQTQPMESFRVVSVTRGAATVEAGATNYIVSGEGLPSGWEIFPQMVYRVEGSETILVEDESERASVVASLCEYWDHTGFTYILERQG